jgi:hypothetical protein
MNCVMLDTSVHTRYNVSDLLSKVLGLNPTIARPQVIVWQASSGSASSEGLESLRLLKVVRMLKLVRAIRLVRFLDRLQSKEGFQTLKKAIQVEKFMGLSF